MSTTTELLKEYIRVSKARRCPICQRDSWCLIHRYEPKVICPRVDIGSVRPMGSAGHLHLLEGEYKPPPPVPEPEQDPVSPEQIVEMAKKFFLDLDPKYRDFHATTLGVSPWALHLLRVGWSKGAKAYTWPMRSSTGDVIGIRLRNDDARKWAVRGSKNGLFIPSWGFDLEEVIQDGVLTICEGPTDAAALLDLGFAVIGRPSNTGGALMLQRYISATYPRDKRPELVIICDRDPWHSAAEKNTQKGVQELVRLVSKSVKSVKIIRPPDQKDIRQWVQDGGTKDMLLNIINSANYAKEPKNGRRSRTRTASRTADGHPDPARVQA